MYATAHAPGDRLYFRPGLIGCGLLRAPQRFFSFSFWLQGRGPKRRTDRDADRQPRHQPAITTPNIGPNSPANTAASVVQANPGPVTVAGFERTDAIAVSAPVPLADTSTV